MIYNLNKEKTSINIGLGLLILSQIFFIGGSLLVNLLTIFSIFAFFIFSKWKKNYEFLKKYKLILFIIIFYFIINILSSDLKLLSAIKAIVYLRFFLFSFAIVFFLKAVTPKINIYINFLFLLIIFLIIDSLIQFYFGKDIFGYSYNYDYLRISGPFGDEWIIGYYILNIGFLTLSYLNFFKKINSKQNILFILLISLIILYSGERTSYFSIYVFLFFMFIFSNKKKLILISTLLVIIFSLILINQPFGDKRGYFLSMKYNLTSLPATFKWNSEKSFFQKETTDKNEISSGSSKDEDKRKMFKIYNQVQDSKWMSHFSAGIGILKENILTGSGFRTFRHVCHNYEKNRVDKTKMRCSTHPHNFHIEILSENGVLGYFIFASFVIYIFLIFFKQKLYKDFGCSILFCLIITFVLPFKTTGSFFTTNTSYIFWLLVAHFFNLKYQIKNIKPS